MKKVNIFMETHLPWFLNNGIKYLTQLILLIPLILLISFTVLIQPFKREFRDGSAELCWGWEDFETYWGELWT